MSSMSARRNRTKVPLKTTKQVAIPSIRRWKEIEEEDIEEDGLIALEKGCPIKWNTYRSVPDYTRWTQIHDTGAYTAFDNAELQTALATAFGNKLNAHDKSGTCKVSSHTVRSIRMPNDGMVQIPYRTERGLEVVAFRPALKLEIPDDPVHTVQRRTNRWASTTPSQQQVSSIMETGKHMKLTETEELQNTVRHGKPCIVLRVKKGEDVQEDVVWP